MSEADDALPRSIRRWVEALTWHEALAEAEEELTSSLIRDWQAWYSDPENRRVIDILSRLIGDSRHYRPRNFRWLSQMAAGDYDLSLPIAIWKKTSSWKGERGQCLAAAKRRLWFSLGATVAAMSILVGLISWRSRVHIGGDHRAAAIVYQTAIGGLRDVRLGDGSVVTLAGGTKLSVDYSARVRAVQLVRGEAWFRVAHDPQWPFVVHAGRGVIRAVGTAFLVTRDSDRVIVTVTEGTVAVTSSPLVKLPPAFGGGTELLRQSLPIRVSRGAEVSYRDNGRMASVKNADMHVATAWTHGRLIYDNEQLRYVVEDINRYSPRYVFATPAAGRLRFSGVVLPDGIQDWVQGLSEIFPVDVAVRGASICIRLNTETTSSPCHAPP